MHAISGIEKKLSQVYFKKPDDYDGDEAQ